MTSTVDLFNPAVTGRTEGQVWSTDAATFKEIPSSPRVLADSQNFLVYSMKKPSTLRVVNRANLKKGSVHEHTAPVNAVRFVNYRSNVVASSAEGEFLVWVVTDETGGDAHDHARLTVRVYFKLQDPVTIRSFSFFINAENNKPDLLLLYDQTAAILESSVLISRFESEPLSATLQQNSTPIRALGALEERCLCSVGSGGWFAFTTEPAMAAACTLRNRSTPSWACCEGAAVQALHLLDTPREETTILVAASSNTVFQWTLTGVAEPSLIRKFSVPGTIVVMESSRDTFAVFDDQKQLALVAMESPDKYTCTHYSMPCQVRSGGVCLNRIGTGANSTALVDKSDRLTVFHLKGSASAPSPGADKGDKAKPTAKAVTPVTAGVTTPSAATPTPTSAAAEAANPSATTNVQQRAGSSIAANLLHQLGLQNSQNTKTSTAPTQRLSPYGSGGRPITAGLSAYGSNHTQETAGRTDHSSAPQVQGTGNINNNNNDSTASNLRSPPATTDATSAANKNNTVNNVNNNSNSAVKVTAASRPAIHNVSLPQAPIDGVLASAVHQTEEDVGQSLERLQSAMANTSQILQLVPDTIRRDHAQLLNLGLEAQMTELQQKIDFSSGHGGSGNANSGGVNATVFDTYALMMLITPLSANIAKGVTRGVEEALTTHLDHEVRHAIGNRIRATQKQIIKARLDKALKDSTAHFATQVEQSVQNVVKHELVEALSAINGTVVALVNENERLQSELRAVMSCGAVDELRRAREELRALRETVAQKQSAAGGPLRTSAFAARRPSAETILSTAGALLREERYAQGLEYIAAAGHPPLTLQLLAALSRESEAQYSALVEDEKVPEEAWCRILAQIAEAAAAKEVDVEEKEAAVSMVFDLLLEKEGLLNNNPRGRELTAPLLEFLTKARAEITSAKGVHRLKYLQSILL